MSCLDLGSAGRQVGTTNMNEHSSRSHTIFTLYIGKTVDIVFPCAECHSFHMQLLTVLCSILPHIQPSFHGKWPCLQFFSSMWVTITSEQGINHYMYALFATVSCILSECIVFSCVLIGHFWIIRIYPFLWDWGECLTTTTTTATTTTTLYFVSKSQRTIFQTLTTGS